ncbi:MAG: DUF1573 domain-containing protein [Bacteroidetes bacterium]|nr:DUF1573 domain-containing protein [Bacteroidota bacterium]MBS1609642.1 DUF1573 domain-containing protein [Bacteroidota bacterium]
MYKILTLILLIAAFSAGAQNSEGQLTQAPNSVLKFKVLEHDFSQIPQGKPVFYVFEFENAGKETIKLDNVQASCGCTTPEWSHDPVAPGATAKIKVGYNAAAEGNFEKYITVTYGGNLTQQIKIKGMVWRAPSGSAPANTSIQFLKQQNF